jgi:SAM-dependent methyltransferase
MKSDAIIAILKGAATYVPGLYSTFGQQRMNVGDSARAEYFYGVWMKHISILNKTFDCGIPQAVVELGPGDTLGVGVCSLLSGSSKYIGVDAAPFARGDHAVDVANALVQSFNARRSVDVNGWPDFKPLLDDQGFLSSVLSEAALKRSLATDRVASILNDVRRVAIGRETSTDFIDYLAPASNFDLSNESVDLVMSHSVLEHVVDVRSTLQSAYRWLKPGGLMSHQYDLSAHGIVESWDGHRAFDASTWRVVVGKRPFMINRLPHSRIVEEVNLAGFEILVSEVLPARPTLAHRQLCKQWQAYSEEDIRTSGGFIQARKRL